MVMDAVGYGVEKQIVSKVRKHKLRHLDATATLCYHF